MKPAKEITLYRYLLLCALGLVFVAIAGFIMAQDFQKSFRTLMVTNNKISHIQSDAAMHLINYAQTGNVRDLQRFRSAASPLVDLARVMNDTEHNGTDTETVEEVYLQVGLSVKEASRLFRLNSYFSFIPYSMEDLDSWSESLNYHYRMFDISRRLLRDHVHGQMNPSRTGESIRELQELERDIKTHHAAVDVDLVRTEERVAGITRLLLLTGIIMGLLFIGYTGYHVEKNWKRHERSLYRSRNRYQEMFEQAGIGIVQVSIEGKLIWANPAMARILGYNSVEDLFAGLSLFERLFVDPERKNDFKTGMFENGSVSNFMYRATTKDEKKIWLLCNATVLRDDHGRILCYEASYQDYTIYRQTNQELHSLTSILRGMAQSIYQLLLTREFDDAINELLKIIGKAGSFDRVYVSRNLEYRKRRISRMEYEWVKYDSLSVLHDSVTSNIKMQEVYGEAAKQLEEGNIVQLVTNQTSGSLQSLLKKTKVRVTMLAPVHVEGRFWGVLGFDNCANDDQWNGDILQVVKTISSALGHFIRKSEVETSLRENKDQYGTLVGNIKEVVFKADQEGVFRYLNKAWETITGYTLSDCIGRNINDFIHKDDLESVSTTFKKMVKKQQGIPRTEFRLITKKGSVRWLEWTCHVMKDPGGSSHHIYGTMYDLTERKRAELMMMQNNQRLEALIESSPMIITVTDTDGYLTLWNRAAEQIMGWSRGDVLGKPAPDIPEEQYNDHYELLDRVLSGEHMSGIELERKRKDGSTIYLSLTASPLYDSDGRVEQVITFAHDITESRFSKEAIRKSLKEKNVLLSEIHHRVKNNMAVISSLLSLKAQEQSDPAVAEVLTESENRIRSMSMIHEKLYQTDTFAEIEFGRYLQELAAYIENHYTDSGQRINTTVRTDEIYLEITQAVPCGLFVNEILTNGFKHAFPKRSEGNITLSFTLNGEYCELYYKDDGIGMPENMLTDHTGDSLGSHLIHGLSQQLKGKLEMGNDHGAYIRLRFRLI